MTWTAKAKAELSHGNGQNLKHVLSSYLRADVLAALGQLVVESQTPEEREKWQALIEKADR